MRSVNHRGTENFWSMTVKKIIRAFVILAILACNVSCDQVSKNIVRKCIGNHQEITLIQNHLTLTKIENSGAFLSVGSTLPQPLKILLLIVLPLVALLFAVAYIVTKTDVSKVTVTSVCFVVGGGVGNLYDRVVYGSVTDFLHIDFGLFQTGIFNLADVSIMTGLALIFVELSRHREKYI
jgi:signal peptidase II